MNKTDLVNQLGVKLSKTKKESAEIIDAIFGEEGVIVEGLKDNDKIALVGFGTFEKRERAARKGRNPATGEEIEIAASVGLGFKAGKILKEAVKG